MSKDSFALRSNNRAGTRLGILSVIGIVALVLLISLFTSWRTISPGYVGIVFDKSTHQVTNTLDPGWVFINPLTQSITHYPISLQTLTMVQAQGEGQNAGDDSVKIGSREGQTLYADVSVQYSVERDHAADLYRTWAGAPIEAIQDNLVRQVTRSVLSDVGSQYGWEDIYGTKRTEYTQLVSAEITKRFDAKFVKFESLSVRSFHLPDNLQKALDAKIAAQQAAEQQSYALQQAKVKAQQDQAEAEGRANALRAQAQGEADATKIRAAAQAEANKQLAQSLTPELIRYQQLQRWDGKLPVFTGGATPLVNATDMISDTVR